MSSFRLWVVLRIVLFDFQLKIWTALGGVRGAPSKPPDPAFSNGQPLQSKCATGVRRRSRDSSRSRSSRPASWRAFLLPRRPRPHRTVVEEGAARGGRFDDNKIRIVWPSRQGLKGKKFIQRVVGPFGLASCPARHPLRLANALACPCGYAGARRGLSERKHR